MNRKKKRLSSRPPIKKQATGSGDLLRIAARMGNLAVAAELIVGWREKLLTILSSRDENKDERIVRAGQIIKDAGIDVDFGNASICFGAEHIAEDRIKDDAERVRISAAIRKKEKEYGLKEDEYWPAGEAPDDVETLRAAHDKRCRQIEADVLREFGEYEMASALMADEAAFIAKYREPGCLALFGPLSVWPGQSGRGIPGQVK
jgi:hypothetical protein